MVEHKSGGKSLCNIVKRISFASTVAQIWQERNKIIFNNERCKYERVFGHIIDEVKNRLLGIKAPYNIQNYKVCNEWGVSKLGNWRLGEKWTQSSKVDNGR
uniref:Uncharacterized protein n=1 Tax=Lactuca sativa TaxID=4236 RepID=A0A9R1WJQ9_LACSA|nr:hypothetical protein LSAT_V11C100045060 [Lactuca sativa]